MGVSAWFRPALVATAAVLMLAACGGAQGNTKSSGSSSSNGSVPPRGSAVHLATATVQGTSERIFTNRAGRTLYYFTPDKDAKVTCTGGCATIWPPCTAASAPTSLTGVSVPGTFGTLPNPSGGPSIVTYNGWPLYTFAHDDRAGQVEGQGFQGVWFVATPSLAATPTGH